MKRTPSPSPNAMTTPTTTSRPRAHAERPDENGGHRRPGEETEHRGEPQQDEAGRAGKPELREGVHRERHVSRDDESAHDPGDDGDDEPGRDRVLNEVVREQRDDLVHQRGSTATGT